MRIDFATLAFGYTIKTGGGTPNWATSLGQGNGYKINNNPQTNELLKGIIYSSVSLSKITSKIGKGGKVISGNDNDSPIMVAALFKKVYINETLIPDANFIIMVTKDTSESHAGRLRFKYGPSNTYNDGNVVYSNEDFWKQVKNSFNLGEKACFFVYDISVENQNELYLRTIIVNKYASNEYINNADHHAAWDALIEEDEKKRGIKTQNLISEKDLELYTNSDNLTPEWFKQKALNFPERDKDAQEFLLKFKASFAPGKLQVLFGKELLNNIFLNSENKTNLCYVLEFDNDCRYIFGSIKSGTSYKYGLHYSQKNKSWATGTSKNPKFLSEEEAIDLGTQIRDYLLLGAEFIAKSGAIKSLEDYQKLYTNLYDITDGYINKVWFMKYYTLLFPEIFPPIYSTDAQNKVLNKLGITPANNPISRMGQIRNYVDKCEISNVVFSAIFWTYCNEDNIEENDDEIIDTNENLKSCYEVIRTPRKNKTYPLNFIVYGAPGTGKTYSMVEYALAIIENVDIEKFRATHTNRKENVNQYKQLIKNGQIVFTTFHQNYGYEEFIQGLRPDKNSNCLLFETIDGVFKKIADKALNDSEGNNFVIIIDEINRANISKVFGELITLIEADKRWGEQNEMSATLQSGDVFAVPNNLYIVGTMNSADKSISLIDAALRRRFDFIEQKPNLAIVKDNLLRAVLENINNILVKDLDSTDLLIGHSYFINKTKNDLPDILNNNIIPLLYEYYYDNRKKVRNLLETTIKQIDARIEIVDEQIGRLKVRNAQ